MLFICIKVKVSVYVYILLYILCIIVVYIAITLLYILLFDLILLKIGFVFLFLLGNFFNLFSLSLLLFLLKPFCNLLQYITICYLKYVYSSSCCPAEVDLWNSQSLCLHLFFVHGSSPDSWLTADTLQCISVTHRLGATFLFGAEQNDLKMLSLSDLR